MVFFAGIVIVIMRAYPGGLSALLISAKRRFEK
jgi:hypothetical protein